MLAEAVGPSDEAGQMQCDVLTVARMSDQYAQRRFRTSSPEGADGEDSGLCVYVHGLGGGWLGVIRTLAGVSTVHAGEVTHISISVGLSQCGWGKDTQQLEAFEHWALLAGPEVALDEYAEQMDAVAPTRFTSLRVLEVLQVCPSELPLAGYCTRLAVGFVRSTASTLQSLVIVGAGWAQQRLVEMLRAAGPTLHRLCLFVVECDCFVDVQTDETARNHTNCLLELGDAAHNEDERMEDEMKTEMLRNSAEGLCISLQEPARILAHVHTKRTEFAQVLPKVSWFQ